MKKTKLALTMALCGLIAGTTFAQDAKEIVKKHNDAVGGTEKWSKVNSLRKEGTMKMQGMEMPTVLTILKGKGMRQEFNVMGANNYVILTPTGGWTYLPVQGQTKTEPIPAAELTDIADKLDFQDKIMEASAKNYAIELLGKEDIDGKPAFKLKVTDAAKEEHTYFVDAATWYLVKAIEKTDVMGQKVDATVIYSNHTKLPSGIVIAMNEDSGDMGSLSLSKVEENTVKDESFFKP
jgi:outer membrane lipoprotein-sorting protein